MKRLCAFILPFILLCTVSINSRAAFVIKSPVASAVKPDTKVPQDVSQVATGNSLSGFQKEAVYRPYQPYGQGGGEARRAYFWAMWGIIIWPLGILAIIHGARALSRSHGGRSDDIAGISVVLGSLEVLATIFAIVFFFAFII